MTTTTTRPPARRPDRPAARAPRIAMSVNGRPWPPRAAVQPPAPTPAPTAAKPAPQPSRPAPAPVAQAPQPTPAPSARAPQPAPAPAPQAAPRKSIAAHIAAQVAAGNTPK